MLVCPGVYSSLPASDCRDTCTTFHMCSTTPSRGHYESNKCNITRGSCPVQSLICTREFLWVSSHMKPSERVRTERVELTQFKKIMAPPQGAVCKQSFPKAAASNSSRNFFTVIILHQNLTWAFSSTNSSAKATGIRHGNADGSTTQRSVLCTQ